MVWVGVYGLKKEKKKILLVLYDNPIKSQKPSQEALSKEKAAVLMYVPKSDLNLFRRNICIHARAICYTLY